MELIAAKAVIAVLAGLLVDGVMKLCHRRGNEENEPYHDPLARTAAARNTEFYTRH